MTKVTSSKFQKNFGQYKELAQRNPVYVTSNGRDSVVLISTSEYAAFEAFKNAQYAYEGQVTDAFKNDAEQFMNNHEGVLKGLAK